MTHARCCFGGCVFCTHVSGLLRLSACMHSTCSVRSDSAGTNLLGHVYLLSLSDQISVHDSLVVCQALVAMLLDSSQVLATRHYCLWTQGALFAKWAKWFVWQQQKRLSRALGRRTSLRICLARWQKQLLHTAAVAEAFRVSPQMCCSNCSTRH